jgi:hypothetical protein
VVENPTYDKIYKARLEHLQSQEAEKTRLHDSKTANPEYDRASPQFIDESLGERKSVQQIEQEASKFAHEFMLEHQKGKIEAAHEFEQQNRLDRERPLGEPIRIEGQEGREPSKLDQIAERSQNNRERLENRPSFLERMMERTKKKDGREF